MTRPPYFLLLLLILISARTADAQTKTLYSYTNGNWDSADTWTTDPSGIVYYANGVPDQNTRAVILNGRTVTVSQSTRRAASLEIENGAVLDLQQYTGHTFQMMSGRGLMRLSSGTLPAGDMTAFVAPDGGTVEYYGNITANVTFNRYEFNHLILNADNAARVFIVNNTFTVNGDLTVRRGDFRIGNSTASRTVSLNNVTVESGGKISIYASGAATTNHRVSVNGDFVNNGGTVSFCTITAEDYTADRNRATVTFTNPTADQRLVCNGMTRFYWLHVDKGNDPTYMLDVQSNNSAYFRILGRNNRDGAANTIVPDRALFIYAGTLRLGPNIVVPRLMTKTAGETNYDIGPKACFWIDGARVTVGAEPQDHSITIYGKLLVSGNSVLLANTHHGIVMREAGIYEQRGGTVTAKAFRTSSYTEEGTHRGAVIMSGGQFILESSGTVGSVSHATFCLPFSDNIFKMSGGQIMVQNSKDGTAGTGNLNLHSWLVSSGPGNYSVTGGTVTIAAGNRSARINSTAPFYNLILTGNNTSGTHVISVSGNNQMGNIVTPATAPQPLVVLNDLHITNRAVLTPTVDISVGGNFTVEAGTAYNPGSNTTFFNGSSTQQFIDRRTVGTGSPALNHVRLENRSVLSVTNTLNILGELYISGGTVFRDNGRTVRVWGNIVNDGTHESQPGGAIILYGSSNQEISGNGNGMFGNLTLDKTSGTNRLTAAIMVNGALRLAGASSVLSTGSHRLTLGPSAAALPSLTATSATRTDFSASRMISTNGLPSDGGVATVMSQADREYLVPFGTAGKYTPAVFSFTSPPAQWGTIVAKPVHSSHPNRTSDHILNYYWNVTSEGFSGIAENSMRKRFYYREEDLHPGAVENRYIPGVYRPDYWEVFDASKISTAIDEILFDRTGAPDGDFTAGYADAMYTSNAFYSRQSGNWDTSSTWTNDETGNTPAASVPGPHDPVIIRNGHTVTISQNGRSCGNLHLREGGTLDLGTTTGHSLGASARGKIYGNGVLRISSATATATLPSGDFGDFLGRNGGTVEYYTTGTVNFTISHPYNNYHHLVVNPGSGRTITFPAGDIQVYNHVTVKGAGTVSLNAVAAQVDIGGNLDITGGTLQYPSTNTDHTVTVRKALTINGGAAFNVVNSGTTTKNVLRTYGNIINNGTLNLRAGASRYADLYFLGEDTCTFSGTGANTFYRVFVDKGNSQAPLLDITANNFDLYTALGSQPLIIDHGTVRFSGTSAVILSTTYPFVIPQTGALAVNGSTVSVGSGSSNDADLLLSGRLEISGGTLNIGNTAYTTVHHDIEYSGAGEPEIRVSGGTLNVNGQVRRSVHITEGSLVYRQSGGSVNIYGNGRQISRGLLEITNPGSLFEMSGGDLTLVNGVSAATVIPSFSDLYLNPGQHNVTGGTIYIGNAATRAGAQYFNLYLGCPAGSITVDGNAREKTAVLRSVPATVNDHLSINGPSASVFNPNGLDVFIGGDMTSSSNHASGGYQATAEQNTTFFGDRHRMVYGTLRPLVFGKLTIDMEAGKTIWFSKQEIQIGGDAVFRSGYLVNANDATHRMIAKKDVYIGNRITWTANTRPFTFRGSSLQNLYAEGGGEICCIEIDNAANVRQEGNLSIKNRILLTNGSLDIGSYSLMLGEDTRLEANPPAGPGKMIITNGTLADGGVTRKFVPGGTYADFTFPVGVAGKYTPVTVNMHDTGGAEGTVTVKPVNSFHPARNDGIQDNELQYYWNVTSTGFGPALDVTHVYHYVPSDMAGNENDYTAGRFHNMNWKPEGGSAFVDPGAHMITWSHTQEIDGEYTAGIRTNFRDKPVLYSRQTGNWETSATWSTTPGGTSPYHTTPDGNPVFIQAGHTVTVTANSAFSYSTDIAEGASLILGTTIWHNFGHISGGGALGMTASNDIFTFPAGNYDEFMNTPTSTIIYHGAGILPSAATLRAYPNIVFTGTGNIRIPAIDITVRGNLLINEGFLENAFNGNITVGGNWTSNVTGGFIAGAGTVTFNGPSSVINSRGGETFHDLRIDRAGAEVTLACPVTVTRNLHLDQGYIFSDDTHILFLSSASAGVVRGGGTQSFVHGPLRKAVAAGSSFVFPVGNTFNGNKRYGPVTLRDISAGGNWAAQYFAVPPPDREHVVSPLSGISENDYWRVTGAGTAHVHLRWDEYTQPVPDTEDGREKLRVAAFNGSAWESVGQSVTDNGRYSGTVETANTIPFTGEKLLAVGLDETATAKLVADASTGMCDDGSTLKVVIEFTGDGPWSLDYAVNGVTRPVLSNLTSPHEIIFAYNDLSVGTNEISLVGVYDRNGRTGVVLPGTVTLTLKETPDPLITGPERAAINSQTTFNVPSVPGNGYSWMVENVPAASVTGNGTPHLTVTWGSATGNAVIRLIQINSHTGCSRMVEHHLQIIDWPAIIGNLQVCAGATETYRTNPRSGHSYLWTVVDGAITGADNREEVTIEWSSASAGSVTLLQQGESLTETVTIHPNPSAAISVTGDDEICEGEDITLSLSGTDRGALFSYRITRNGTDVDHLIQTKVTSNPFPYTTTGGHTWNPADAGQGYTEYLYGLVITNETTGCTSPEATVPIRVSPYAKTGPIYRLSNE